MMGLEPATPWLKTEHFVNSMKRLVSLYVYQFSTVVDFSSKKYSGSTGHRNS